MSLDHALQNFIIESRELLEEMESALLGVEHAQADSDTINAIFRAAHTIKGSSGLFGLDHVVAFTHVVEGVLEAVRNEAVKLDANLIALLLSCGDHISALLDAIAAGRVEEDPALTQQGEPLIERLRTYFPASRSSTRTDIMLGVDNMRPVERIDGDSTGGDNWHISLRFGSNVLQNGMDPLSFLRYLGTLGTIVEIITLHEAVPVTEDIDPEMCYLGFEIAFKSSADKAAIESVFEFVRDDCRIRIVPPHSHISEYIRLIQEFQDERALLGEMLIKCGTITANELATALQAQLGEKASQPLGEILISQGAALSPVVEAALSKQSQVREAKNIENRSVRVDAEKLDHLINLIGELIITAASANLIARRAKNTDLQECASTLSALVEDVRDSALQLRMVKIGATFNRFQRVVHDVSRELGKDIGLVVTGEDTELDKTVVEKITDPLTHLVRNAIDHGIERLDLRTERGKPAQGTISLNSYHDSGTIVIEVSDDGGGLKREKILAKALEQGIVEPGRILSDDEIYSLIFEPGFSTAEQVTNLSGRGVGMDVVKRNITALRGSVNIHSKEGVGTIVTVRLPLTLAIINGFLVEVGKSMFVIPLDMIEECVAFSTVAGHEYTDLRGQVLPFIRMRELFEVGGAVARRESIVVVKYGGQKTGLVVDTLLGEFQTVIKPLNKMFNHVKCISGSTILGSGHVALILDVPALLQQVGAAALPTSKSTGSVALVE